VQRRQRDSLDFRSAAAKSFPNSEVVHEAGVTHARNPFHSYLVHAICIDVHDDE